MAESQTRNLIAFESQALAADDLMVTQMNGVDEMSRMYGYELELVSKKPDIDIDAVLSQTATLKLRQGITTADGQRATRVVQTHGIVSRFRQGDKRNDWIVYHATLVPRMWRLTRRICSQVYLDCDVKALVKQNLEDAGLQDGVDFEFRLSGSYPTREYVVQYEESDFDFICRWLEHEGIFWFFEQMEDGEKLVFGDSTAVYRFIAGGETLRYKPKSAADNRAETREGTPDDWFAEEVVTSWICDQNMISKDVSLKDYNWRNPADPLTASADTGAPSSWGSVWEYNDHFKTDGEGKQLAQVRAEELVCREKVFIGESDCRSLQAGATFQLSEHFRGDFNQEVLLVRITHQATQTIQFATSETLGATYENVFHAIPRERVFRPQRVTEWPSIKGAIQATVDSSAINDDGSYRIRLPFDVAGGTKGAGGASRWVRMSQAHSGDGYGMHFPLHAGDDVLLTHVDGDPDRPVISGTVPNPSRQTPVNITNITKNIMQTSTCNVMEMDDTGGLEGVTIINGTKTAAISLRTQDAGGSGGPGGVGGNSAGGRADDVSGVTGCPYAGMDKVGPGAQPAVQNSEAGAGGAVRAAATMFLGSGTRYDVVNGDYIDAVCGSRGEYTSGPRVRYVEGPRADEYRKVTDDRTEIDATKLWSRIHTSGDHRTELYVDGNLDLGKTTIACNVVSDGPKEIGGNIVAENTVIGGSIIGGRHTKICGNVVEGGDPAKGSMSIEIDGNVDGTSMCKTVHGNVDGMNTYIDGYNSGETIIGTDNTNVTMIGGNDTSTSTIGGNVSSTSNVAGATSSTSVHGGPISSISVAPLTNSISVVGLSNSIDLSTKTSLFIGATLALELSYAITLKVAGSLDFEITKTGIQVKEDQIKVLKNELSATNNEITASNNRTAAAVNELAGLINMVGSSKRWKQNISTLGGALDLVQELRGVRYEWKDDGRADVGFIAEEVGEVLPEIVEFADDGVHANGVCYDKITAVLVEAMKEQQAQIDALRREVAELKAAAPVAADANPFA